MYSFRSQILLITFIKIAYTFFAVFVFARFTSLGDTQDYLSGEYLQRNNLMSTAYLMSLIGNALGKWGSFILSVVLSVSGIFYLIKKSKLNRKHIILMMIIIALPSFGVWTSVLSKEVFVLFSFCLSVGGLIDLYTRKRRFFSLVQLLGLALLTFIKPHYSASIYFSLVAILVYQAGFRKELMLALMVFVFSLVGILCIQYIDDIFKYTQIMPLHFSQNGGSTRINTFWLNEWDFFSYLPIGGPVSFIGPTLLEVLKTPKLLPFLLEGYFLFGFIIVFSFKAIFYKTKLNVTGLLLVMTFVLTLLITHYPFGLFNPGSAVRYRSGFIFPLCVFLLFLVQQNRPLRPGKSVMN